MKKYLFLLLFIVMLSGCCSLCPQKCRTIIVHEIVPCPKIGAQPTLYNVTMTKFTIVDKNTGKEIIYYGFPEGEALKFKTNVEMLKDYAQNCFDLIGGK